MNPTSDLSTTEQLVSKQEKQVKRFIGIKNLVPEEICNDPLINLALTALPANYNFEIHKTIWRIREKKATCVALQFPEGLIMFSCIISDILIKYSNM